MLECLVFVLLEKNYIFNVIHARKFVSLSLKKISLKRHIKPLFVMSVAAFFAAIYNKIDVTMLGSMCNDSIVGIYSNAHKSVNIVLSATTAITAVFLPRLSSLFTDDINEFKQVVVKGTKIVSYMALPMFVAVLILSPELIQLLYGSAFSDASSTLMAFSPLIIINSFGNLYAYQLMVN